MIYTIFTLSTPANPEDVRFISMTTQLLKKRYRDIVSAALSEKDCAGQNSFLSQWIRELAQLSQEPLLSVVLNTPNEDEAQSVRRALIEKHLPSGRLLHSQAGRNKGRFLATDTEKVVNFTSRKAGDNDFSKQNEKVKAKRLKEQDKK